MATEMDLRDELRSYMREIEQKFKALQDKDAELQTQIDQLSTYDRSDVAQSMIHDIRNGRASLVRSVAADSANSKTEGRVETATDPVEVDPILDA